jgi:hypothetical protein
LMMMMKLMWGSSERTHTGTQQPKKSNIYTPSQPKYVFCLDL